MTTNELLVLSKHHHNYRVAEAKAAGDTHTDRVSGDDMVVPFDQLSERLQTTVARVTLMMYVTQRIPSEVLEAAELELGGKLT